MSNLAFSIRSNEGCAPQPILTWDTVWDAQSGFADWAYADRSEASNRGGLQAQAALQTAVILCLFTDRYCPPDHPLAFLLEGDDPRGWWGDGVDVARDQGEAPLGSLLLLPLLPAACCACCWNTRNIAKSSDLTNARSSSTCCQRRCRRQPSSSRGRQPCSSCGRRAGDMHAASASV